tara:strand:- start:122 stop:499 length:378 start_codon:yes stop_codon:yes gene_type:complete
MTIITKGMGAIMKGVKKRKTLTISTSPKSIKQPPRKGEVIIKKPSKTKLADTWQDRRIQAINRKIKPSRGSTAPDYAQEASDIYGSKALTKKQYKTNQKKFYSLPEKERHKIWKIRSRRELKGKK